LDPAEPCFHGKGLNRNDAIYVDVIHTGAQLFGREAAIGTKDFYPNGGKIQPGCALRRPTFLQHFPSLRDSKLLIFYNINNNN